MKVVQYTGRAHNRVVRKEDWQAAGIDMDEVAWSKENAHRVEMKNEAAEWLIKKEPRSFKITEDPEPATESKPATDKEPDGDLPNGSKEDK